MMKFFRKYTKHLLAVFMTLLLIVWLGGSALTNSIRNRRDGQEQVRGKAFGDTVRLGDMMPAFNAASTLDRIVPNWRLPWLHTMIAMGMDQRTLQQNFFSIRPERLDESEWYMLQAHAIKGGIYVPPEAVQRFKANAQIAAQRIDLVRQQQRISLEQIDRTIQSYLRVLEAAKLACQAVSVSEADIQDFVRGARERVQARFVLFEGKTFVDASYEPTEEELKAQLAAYKNTASGPSGRGLEFGYRLPEAVQIEYIKIDVDALAQSQTIADDVAHEYWTKNRSEFLKPADPPAPTTSTAPAEPPKPEPPKPYATFTEAKQKVIEKLRHDQAKDEALKIASDLITRLNKPWADAPTTKPHDYKVAPDHEKGPTVYADLVASQNDKHGGALSSDRTELLTQAELSKAIDFARATAMQRTPQQATIVQAAFMVAGLSGNPEDNENLGRYYRNVYETCSEPFVVGGGGDDEGDVYIFRTVGALPKRAPAGIDTVRSRLVEDVRKKRGYEEAERQARAFAEKVGNRNLEDVFNRDEALKEKLGEKALITPKPFTRKSVFSMSGSVIVFETSIPSIGRDPELVERCFASGSHVMTEPAKAAIFGQEKKARWLVFQTVEILPVTEEEYADLRNDAQNQIRTARQLEVIRNWFAPEQIRARINWEDPPEKVAAEEDRETDDEAAS